jgi:SagB-type dehydrogenase family enzyme
MNNLRIVSRGDQSLKISESLLDKNIAYEASLIIFITAIFERSTLKYSDRGYRFVLLEAGHIAQNINLVINGMGLGCINLGGFFDRQVDELLELDGINHSTIYMIAIGKKLDEFHTSEQ